jgi:hypothetical protein
MPAFRPRIRALAVGVGAFALVAVAAGGTFAASNPATLYACYDNYGNVRMGDTAQCKLPGGGRVVSWSTAGVPGPTGAPGPTGPAGPQGQPGPQYVINAVVNGDGSLLVSTVPTGTSLTVTRSGAGDYLVTISGMGNSCPVPTANAFAPTFMFLNGGSCGGGGLTTTLETGDGLDHPFALLAVGSGPAPAAPINSFGVNDVSLPTSGR